MFPVFAVVGAMPWSAAKSTWLVLNLLSLAALIILVIRECRVPRSGLRRAVLVGTILALVPVHTSVAIGQQSIVVVTLALAACWAAERNRPWVSGVLMALGLAVKPHLAGAFWLYLLYKRQWHACAVACVVTGILGVIGAGQLQLHHIAWWADLRANFHDHLHGGAGDPTIANPARFQLIDLHYPLHELTGSRVLVDVIVLAVTLSACAGAVLAARIQRTAACDVALLSVLLVAGTLVTYHRIYDVVLLAIPIGLLIGQWGRWGRGPWWLCALCCATFFTPGGALLHALAEEGWVSESISGSWWWRDIIMPHQIWALLVLMLGLLWQMGIGCRAHPEALADKA